MSRKGSHLRRTLRRILHEADGQPTGCRHYKARIMFSGIKKEVVIRCNPCGITHYLTLQEFGAALE